MKIVGVTSCIAGLAHTPMAAKALEKAAEVDAKIAAGEEISDLAGIPGAIKDNICISGETCTAASRML